jgi:hypothetical protein
MVAQFNQVTSIAYPFRGNNVTYTHVATAQRGQATPPFRTPGFRFIARCTPPLVRPALTSR